MSETHKNPSIVVVDVVVVNSFYLVYEEDSCKKRWIAELKRKTERENNDDGDFN